MQTKIIRSAFAVLCLLLGLLTAGGALWAAQAGRSDTIQVGVSANLPPFEYVDASGKPQGYDVELLETLAKTMDLKLQIEAGPFEKIRSDLEAKRIQMLSGMMPSEERKRYADFSAPHLVIHYGIFVRKGSAYFQNLESLRNKSVIVENGAQMHEYLKTRGFAKELVPVKSTPDALRLLASGAHDAAVVPLLVSAIIIRDDKLSNLQRVGEIVFSREMCFGVAKGNEDLVALLNTGLAILHENGEQARIYKKWFGNLDTDPPSTLGILRQGLWIFLPLIGLTLLVSFWTWSLRRQVHARTLELRQLNRALREKETLLQAVVDNLPVAVYGKDPNRDYAYCVWNKRSQELFQLAPQEILGKTDKDLAAPEEAAFYRSSDERAIREGRLLTIPDDHSWGDLEGRIRMNTVKVPVFDEEGHPWMLLGLSEDVTLKRRTEDELLRSRANLAEAQRVAHLGSWEWDLQHDEAHWSEEFCRILNLQPPVSRPSLKALLRRCHPGDRARAIHFLKMAARHGQAAALDHRILLPGENVRFLHTTLEARGGVDGRVRHLFGTSQDITERRNAEEALRQVQKLEGLGVLAGGIAHDFNNLLTAILANLNLAQLSIPEGSKATRFLHNMETAVLRASDLTRQMLAYSGRGVFVIQPLDLNQVAREITQLLKASISKKVEIQFDLELDLPPIEADIAQMQQVLMNLVTNASEAIGDRAGVIHLRTRVCALDAVVIVRDFPGQELAAGTFAMLEVADNGSGMEPETLERLFEPFFTTKFSGRGLGLSALRGILKGHHAGIRIDSEPGKGSTFRIYFPVSATTVTAVSDAKPPSPAPSQQGTILLVDDEPAVRASTAAMLNELGHEVVEAEDGLQALELYQGRLKEFTLVLLDLTMPRMSGHETLRELRKLNPDVKVILCSGYHEQEALREIRRDDLIGFLQKPFRYSDLRTALTQLP